MSLAACLAFYGVLVAVAAPRLLRRGSVEQAPRLGVALWSFAAATTLLAWLAAIGVLVADTLMVTMGAACEECLLISVLPAEAQRLTAAVVATVGIGVVGWIAAGVGRQLWRGRRAVEAHIRGVRLVGSPVAQLGPDTVVLDAAERAAYCLARRGERAVVVTSAVLRDLPGEQLAAVLAHERAHLTGHHHLLLAWLTALARWLGRVPLFRHAADEVARLLEMCADDAAARVHGPRTLVDALVTLVCGPAPEPALRASGTATLDRARRLLRPPSAVERSAARREVGTVLLGAGLAPTVVFGAMLLTTCTTMLG